MRMHWSRHLVTLSIGSDPSKAAKGVPLRGYDLEQQVIAGLLPRPDMLPVVSLALEAEWEPREDAL